MRICGLLPPLRIAWQVFVRPSFPYPSFSWFCRASTKRFGFRWIDLGGVDRRTGSGGFALARFRFLCCCDPRRDLSCQMRPGVIEAPPSYVGSCGSFSNPVRIRCRSVVVLLSSYRDAAIVPLSRRVTAVLPRRRHRRAASSMSCCAAVVPLRCRRPTATPPSFCRGAYDADNVLSDGLPPNRPGRQRPSSRALALQFVHNLPKRAAFPIVSRAFLSFQQFFPFPPSICSLFGKNC